MKLLEIYKAILAAAGLVVSEDGLVSFLEDDKPQPFLVKGKRLVIPTMEHQRNPDKSNIVLFHPLCENTLRGESEVMEAYRSALNTNLQYIFGWLSYQLMMINSSVEEHASLNKDQHEFLSKVKDVKEGTLKFLERIMAAMPVGNPGKSFVSIFIKRSGDVKGKKFARVGVVSFPLYAELKSAASKEAKEVYGVKVTRNADREALIALHEYLIPEIDTVGSHNVGSNDLIAPNLDALMRAFMSVAGPLNDIIDLFANKLHEPDKMRFDSSWVDSFKDLKELQSEIRTVPMQPGNEGASNKAMPETQAVPVQTPAPVQVPQQQYMVPFQPQPMQQQFQPPPPPQPVRTAGGVEWGSLVVASPALQQTVGMNRMMPQMVNPMNPMNQRAGFGQPMMQQPQFQQPQFQQMQYPQGRNY